MDPIKTKEIQCPYCWEFIEIVIDTSAGNQIYVEDCLVCCRPIEISVNVLNEDDVRVDVKRENE